ncbi:G0/G1 switch protein 2 [Pipistrellus kuhlii]|uniref:G0/G1 switch 2 n=1 Tax=Pipistrellus kuhlii TaxID=59472 RepID=A0A7J7UTC4_PIPKU|nr:G0/G1 switch protein 2 [Pipistrellus kuhlii]XP_045439049.1 G0/G1 switch protein 2 [Pipistrellus kuhlii]KAF6316034.1 G0/G1 switch 2 [Pipistrellus kuhlii]
METVQELIPLVKGMIGQKPSRRLVKVYVLGGVLALFGVVLVLVETVCGPFTAASRLRDEEAAVAELRAARERQALHTQALQEKEKGKQHDAALGSRALAHRQHAS